jgi:hypothetical protein
LDADQPVRFLLALKNEEGAQRADEVAALIFWFFSIKGKEQEQIEIPLPKRIRNRKQKISNKKVNPSATKLL